MVNENYGDVNMTIESIAESFYIGASYLSRLFKQLTGISFYTFLRKVRLSKACSLLIDTDISVDNIIKCSECIIRLRFIKHAANTRGLPHVDIEKNTTKEKSP